MSCGFHRILLGDYELCFSQDIIRKFMSFAFHMILLGDLCVVIFTGYY